MVQIWLAVKSMRLKHNGCIDDINQFFCVFETNMTNMHHMKFIRLSKLQSKRRTFLHAI